MLLFQQTCPSMLKGSLYVDIQIYRYLHIYIYLYTYLNIFMLPFQTANGNFSHQVTVKANRFLVCQNCSCVLAVSVFQDTPQQKYETFRGSAGQPAGGLYSHECSIVILSSLVLPKENIFAQSMGLRVNAHFWCNCQFNSFLIS